MVKQIKLSKCINNHFNFALQRFCCYSVSKPLIKDVRNNCYCAFREILGVHVALILQFNVVIFNLRPDFFKLLLLQY